jgi:biopolymer transport protein ExbB
MNRAFTLSARPLPLLLLTCFLTLCGTTSSIAAQDAWKPIQESLAQNEKAVAQDAQKTQVIITREKNDLLKQLTALTTAIAREKTHLSAQKKDFETLLAKEQKARLDLEEQQEDIKTLETVVRTSAKDADTMLHDSLVSPAFPERTKTLVPLLDADHFPGFEDIKNLLSLFMHEVDATGTNSRLKAEIVGPEGTKIEADILRVGAFTAVYRLADGHVGYLRTNTEGTGWIAVPGSLGNNIEEGLQRAFTAKSIDIPLDISRGAALQGIGQQKDTTEWLRSGGLLVWPILFVGVVALLLALERMMVLGRQKITPPKKMTEILTLAGTHQWEACLEICATMSRVPALRVISRAIEAAGSTKDVLEATLEEAILREIPPMERFLATLNVLAAIAPLLGLLGTVTGMISTFQVITLYGTGDPRMMSGGISEALITTQLGLAVAIPIMIVHHFLQRRVENLIGDMEEKGTAFTAAILNGK